MISTVAARCQAWMLGVLLTLITGAAHATDFDFWYAHGGLYAQAIESLCKDFNASSPTDHVHCATQGTYEQTLRKVVAAYRAGRQPAVAEIYDVGTADMLLSGAIYPVNALMHDTGHALDDGDYLQAVRRYYAMRDGHLASLPFSASTLVLYANRKKLAAAGITELPATWEAFERAMAQLHAHGETCPAVIDFIPWKLLEQVSAAQGEAIADADNGHAGLQARYVFANGVERRFMQDVARWHERGWLLPPMVTHANDQTLAFATGECAMLIDATGADAVVAKAAQVDAAVGMIPVYAGTRRYSTIVGGSSLWVLKGESPQVYRGVARFLAYLHEPQQQLAFARRTGYLPLTRDAAQTMTALPPPASGGAARVGLASLQQADNINNAGTRLGFTPLFRAVWQQEVQRALAGDESMSDALVHAQSRGNDLLERFQATYTPAAADAP